MFTPQRLCASCFLILCLVITVLAQAQSSTVGPKAGPTSSIVTASATAERVRFTAPSNVVRMQLQVISESGQILFDVNSKGNVLDWSLQDSSGQRLQGSYLTVVTVKSLSGRLSQRIGTVSVEDKQVELRAADPTGLGQAQQLAVGPIEENAALTILRGDEGQPVTVLANDGKDGEIVRDRGALSFRLGDFFSGNDKEQMRLTEEGNLGIGTAKPKVKLDVAGTIRAREGFAFSDGSRLNVNDKGALTLTNSNGTIAPNIAGTGTQNQVAKWSDNGGTLGNSTITELNGNVGIGTNNPSGQLHIFGAATQDVFAGMGPDLSVGPAFNYGYAGSSFGRSVGFFNVRPDAGAVAPNPSLRFMTANVQRMIVTNTGNVGIGTTNPGYPLTVSGNGSSGANIAAAEFTNGNTDTGIRLRNTTAGGRAWSLFSSGTGSGNGSGRFNIYDANVGRSRFSIDGLGNVGIGPLAPTSNLLFPLNVSGSSPFEPGVVAEFKNSEVGTAIIVHNDASGGGSAWGLSAFSAASSITPGGFSIVDIGGNGNRLSIDNAGRVGIGTTAPGAALQVRNTPADPGSATFFNNAGAMFATANNSGGSTPSGPEPALVLAREGIASQAFANFARFDLKRYENASTASRTQLDIGLTHDDLFYEVNNTPTIMSLRSNGNVGIGNTNPQARLDVNGDINARNLPGITFAQGDCPAHSNCIRQIPFATPFTVDTITINVPAPGFVFVTASTGIDQEGEGPVGGNDVEFNLFQCSDATCGGGTYLARTRNRVGVGTLHISWAIAVNAPGPLTLRTNGSNNNLVYSHYFYLTTHHLSAVYLPKQY